jgi:hypothetical protein
MFQTTITIIYLLLILFTLLFQLGLILGRPWGEWTMGGYNKGVLPTKLRIAPFISILILSFFALFIIDTTKILAIGINFPEFINWFIISFNVLAVIANSITKSEKERKLWQPITIFMLGSSLVVL